MTIEDDFDPTAYARAPKLDVAAAVTLSILLLEEVPKKPSQAVKAAAQSLRKKTLELQTTWKQRDRVQKPADPRPIDIMADGAMSRFYSRIESYSGLPDDRYPLAARARTILATLFPSRLAFLKSDFHSQWSETQKRIERIDEENLAADIDQIAGPEFLAEVRRIHVLYGQAIGTTKSRVTAEMPGLAEPLRAVLSAMGTLGIQLAAVVTDESAEGSARLAARKALAPFDTHRAASARRKERRVGESAPVDVPPPPVAPEEEPEEATPDTIVPELPK